MSVITENRIEILVLQTAITENWIEILVINNQEVGALGFIRI